MTITSSRRSGGLTFAGVVILIAGALDLVWGISALSDKQYFDEESLLFEGLTTWGWVYIVLGALQITVAMMVFSGNGIGIALGMFGAFLAILVNFLAIGAYPIWSCILIAINFLVLFLLATSEG